MNEDGIFSSLYGESMLQCLKALKQHCCFTTVDFQDALLEIGVILEQTASFANKKEQLERAYALALTCLTANRKRQPDRQLAFLTAEILFQYGRLCFDESYFGAKQILLAALNMHFYAVKLLNECIDLRDFASLDALRSKGEAKSDLFEAMEHLIATMDVDCCVSLAYTDTLVQRSPAKRLLNLAQILRWLGHSYQNIDACKLPHPDNLARFEQLFNTSEALLLLADSEESKRELADLYYQAWPFMHQFKDPDDVEGVCALYETALTYDSSTEMQARVANMRFLALFSAGRKDESLPYIQKAIALAETLEDTPKHRFLLANFYHNFAGYLMTPETVDLEQAQACLQRVDDYATACRAAGRDHLYFALYDMRLAELKMVQGDDETAKQIIARALATLQKHPHSQQPHLLKAEAIQSLINQRIPLVC